MSNYLIFRTDRIGDFLITLILIKSIIENNKNANITVIASEKNYTYIKNCKFINNIYLLKDNIFNRLLLIFKLRKYFYKSIIIHDNKKRSKFISHFLKSNQLINIDKIKEYPHIDIIKYILKELNLTFNTSSLNILDDKRKNDHLRKGIVLHFDEKWMHNTYIQKYTNIQPTENELILFIKSLIEKNDEQLKITTGINTPQILKAVLKSFKENELKIFENLNFLELEKIILNSDLLISCHGALSHIAAAINIKQIDIIDKSYNYSRWTKHFRNYNYIYRDSFKNLSKEILRLI